MPYKELGTYYTLQHLVMNRILDIIKGASAYRLIVLMVSALVVASCQNKLVSPKQPSNLRKVAEATTNQHHGIMVFGSDRVDTIVLDKSKGFVDNNKGANVPSADFKYKVTIWNDPSSSTEHSNYFQPIYSEVFTFASLRYDADHIFFKLSESREELNQKGYPNLPAGAYKMVIQAVSDKGVLSYVKDAHVMSFSVNVPEIKIRKLVSHNQEIDSAYLGGMIYMYGSKLEASSITIKIDDTEITPSQKFQGLVGNAGNKINPWGNSYLSFKLPENLPTNSKAELVLIDGLDTDTVTFNLKRGATYQFPRMDFSISTSGLKYCSIEDNFQVVDVSDSKFKDEFKKCIVAEYSNSDVITVKGQEINSGTTFAFKGLNGEEEALSFTKNAKGEYEHTIADFSKLGGQFIVKYANGITHETGYYLVPKAVTEYSSDGSTAASSVAIFGDSVYITQTNAYAKRIWDSVNQLVFSEERYNRDYTYSKAGNEAKTSEFTRLLTDKTDNTSNRKLGFILPTFGKTKLTSLQANWGTDGKLIIPVSKDIHTANKSYFKVNNDFKVTSISHTEVISPQVITIVGDDFISGNDSTQIYLGDTLIHHSNIVTMTDKEIKFRYPPIYHDGPLFFKRSNGHLTLTGKIDNLKTKRTIDVDTNILWTDKPNSEGTLAAGDLFLNGDRELITVSSSISSKKYLRNLINFEFYIAAYDVATGKKFIRERLVKRSRDMTKDRSYVTAREVTNALGFFVDKNDAFRGKKLVIRSLATSYYGAIISDIQTEIILDLDKFIISKVRPAYIKQGDIVRVNLSNYTGVQDPNDLVVKFGDYTVPSSDIVLHNDYAIHFRANTVNSMIGKVTVEYKETPSATAKKATSADIWRYDLQTQFEYNTFRHTDGGNYFTVTTHDIKPNLNTIKPKEVFKVSTNLLQSNRDDGTYSIIFRKAGSIEEEDTYKLADNVQLNSSDTDTEFALTVNDFFAKESAFSSKTAYRKEWNQSEVNGVPTGVCSGYKPSDQFDYFEHQTKYVVDFTWTVQIEGKNETIITRDTIETLPKYAIAPSFAGVTVSSDKDALKLIGCALKDVGNLNWRTQSDLSQFTGVKRLNGSTKVAELELDPSTVGSIEGAIATEGLAALNELVKLKLNPGAANNGKLSIKADETLKTLTKLQELDLRNIAGTGELPQEMCTRRATFGGFYLQDRDGSTYEDINGIKDCKSAGVSGGIVYSDKQAAIEWADAFGIQGGQYSHFRSTSSEPYSSSTRWINNSNLPPIFNYSTSSPIRILGLRMTSADVLQRDDLDKARFLSNMDALKTMVINNQSKFVQIPDALFRLEIDTLHLNDNVLTGVLPDMQFDWKHLKSLYLYGNPLTGKLTDETCENREFYNSFRMQKLDGNILNDLSKIGECNVKTSTSDINFKEAQLLYYAKSALHVADYKNPSKNGNQGPFTDVADLTRASDMSVTTDPSTGRVDTIDFQYTTLARALTGDSTSIDLAIDYLDSLALLRVFSTDGQIALGDIGSGTPSHMPPNFGRLNQLDSLNLRDTKLYGRLNDRACEHRAAFSKFDLYQSYDYRIIDCDVKDKTTQMSHRDKQALIDLNTQVFKTAANIWPRFDDHDNSVLDAELFSHNVVSDDYTNEANYFRVAMRNGRVNSLFFNVEDYMKIAAASRIGDTLQTMPQAWSLLAGLDSLEYLYINGADGSDKLLHYNSHMKFNVGQLEKLTTINVSNSKLTEVGNLLTSDVLTHLYLRSNELTDANFNLNFANKVRKLVALDLRQNQLRTLPSVPESIKELYLSDNPRLDGNIDKKLSVDVNNNARLEGLRLGNLGLSKANIDILNGSLYKDAYIVLGYLDIGSASKDATLGRISYREAENLEVLDISNLKLKLSAREANSMDKLYHLEALDNDGLGTAVGDTVLIMKCLHHGQSSVPAEHRFARVHNEVFTLDSVTVCP